LPSIPDNEKVSVTAQSRPTPDQLLEHLSASEEDFQRRGRLKVFLGYASGVGKSFRMFDEGRRRHERGQDVVVGATQSRSSDEVIGLIHKLEVIPLKDVNGCLVVDVPAILRRFPKVCLIDGLAYDNPPGQRHAKRWQDVEELLEAGIAVIASVNVQHIEEKREQVEAITGKTVQETIPISFLNQADEIVVVDAPADACMRISSDDEVTSVRKLTQPQLSELREIALLLAADVVDDQLARYLARHNIAQSWGTQERILVCLSPRCDSERMIASGIRNRARFHGELLVAYVDRPDWSAEDRSKVERGLRYGEEAGAEIVKLDGEDAVATVLEFARSRGITQIYVGQSGRETWWERWFGSDLDKLIRAAEGIDVRVFPHG
jgi:two-component system, OmpR family, sensor histidine kinase KdpD